MDRLNRSHLPGHLTGKIHLTHFDAVSAIRKEIFTELSNICNTMDIRGP